MREKLVKPSRLNPGRREKANLNFYFHISLRCFKMFYEGLTQPAFTCSKSTMELPEQCLKYVQS